MAWCKENNQDGGRFNVLIKWLKPQNKDVETPYRLFLNNLARHKWTCLNKTICPVSWLFPATIADCFHHPISPLKLRPAKGKRERINYSRRIRVHQRLEIYFRQNQNIGALRLRRQRNKDCIWYNAHYWPAPRLCNLSLNFPNRLRGWQIFRQYH